MNTFLSLDSSFPIRRYTNCTGYNESNQIHHVTTSKLDALKLTYHHHNASLQLSATIELTLNKIKA